MAVVIDEYAIVPDRWQQYCGDAQHLPRGEPVLVPLEEWIEHTKQWQQFSSQIGIVLCASDDAMRLAPYLDQVSLIGFWCLNGSDDCFDSHAHQLRDVLGYRGPIRALGPVRSEMVPALAQTGCDQFELVDTDQAKHALTLISRPAG